MVQFDRAARFFTGEPSTAEAIVVNEPADPLQYDAWNAA